jgi:hypothetical protein
MEWGTLAINIFAAFGGIAGLTALLNVILSRKKLSVEAQDLEQNISDKVLKRVNDDNESLREERDNLKAEMLELKTELRLLREKMGLYEWNQYETRILILRLITWANKANDELNARDAGIEPPPIDDLLNKIKVSS